MKAKTVRKKKKSDRKKWDCIITFLHYRSERWGPQPSAGAASSPGRSPGSPRGPRPRAHCPPVLPAWTRSHFDNAERALWKDSCTDAVGALLTLGFGMSAKGRIKNMQQALRGPASLLPFPPKHNKPTEVKNRENPRKPRGNAGPIRLSLKMALWSCIVCSGGFGY